MRREIKFRAWANTDDGLKMVYFDEGVCDNGIWFSAAEHIDDYKESIMQFTGLKDKKGVEIYEGDILKYGDGKIFENISLGKVTFSSGGFGFKSPSNNFYLGVERMESFEVVGNIYEHPHLLNSEPNDEVSDTTGDDSSTNADKTIH